MLVYNGGKVYLNFMLTQDRDSQNQLNCLVKHEHLKTDIENKLKIFAYTQQL